ncbi:CSC1-like protein HYP1 [Amborella trichopoda]|uniref:CSC1/OSCA1-like cytosolic domain-containing protein n=1 Tax=Amborella trichopoda TaxID=13333 RepID=W1PHB2_AMBTC|nr:CSC1-like protein HYP1 [Amborella trichopoda]XP_011623581.1 CSC1-like protein HYP1 [Amborella trichopoda]XP_011623582.1 CSC1-like protein HYP1 [Amborella trichopoda]XP_020523159.1 CSC1-like protein HYP1 [Amborella trichopoda]XP_020523160.1 CSC1-like protein HYP1 [Amborella trichopoda]XP_020523161.1 CSC1-like protein HYP1 [Amborella trichopoda]ERN06500.1 hypothetical protein AMTR_s00058p00059520 [Amborella trichopoda]|eukprot:XP_006844825.1 CSC1-like protein HYP1 [Amborella trichopoda]
MIVSALLTSVGINLGLCVLFVTLYSILGKQPSNVRVYAPRLVDKGEERPFNLERLLPSAGWLKKAWEPSEDELLSLAGLDAVVFMRIFIFSLRIFLIAGILGIFILLPINYLGKQLEDADFADIPNASLDLFSISNVGDRSKWLWIHFVSVYVITGSVCYLLYVEYKYIATKRLSYFLSSQPQPHHFTILVRGIPLKEGNDLSDVVENFFTKYHSSTYLSHQVVCRTAKLRNLIDNAKNLYRRLKQYNSRPHSQQKFDRVGSFVLFGKRVDPIDHYKKKLEDVEQNVRVEQSIVSQKGKEVPAAFVCFRTRYGAAVASCMQQSNNPTNWITEPAPEPHDVHWPFLSTNFQQRWFSKLVVIVASIFITVIFLIPVVFIQGLANLNQLETLFPFLQGVLSITFVSQVITGYLPSLILHLFLLAIPPIMKTFSSMQGYFSCNEIEKSACSKVLWFTIWNIFFANVFSGSALYQFNILLDPKYIPRRLAVAVPAQASFYISYVVTGWASLSSELTRIFPLIGDCFERHCSKKSVEEFDLPSIGYHKEIPKFLLVGLLGMTYFFLAPIILPFILGYYCLGYIIYRNQLLNVYSPKFETGGKFWPIVHNCTIFSLFVMQVIAVGIFGLKKIPLASSLTVPLPVLTLLFNEYCRKRFLPIFRAYSVESLITRDREDEKNMEMDQFYNKLVNAYRDPALLPIQFSKSEHGNTTPLLHSVEV